MSVERLRDAIRDIPDFPKPGVVFKDITPIIGDPGLFKTAVDMMAARNRDRHIDKIAAVEARGFILGAAVAYVLGVGFIPVRKEGKLPYDSMRESCELEYGTAVLEMHIDAVRDGEQVLIIDDLLATGGTAEATARMIERAGGVVTGIEFLVELSFLKGREKLNGYKVFAPINF